MSEVAAREPRYRDLGWGRRIGFGERPAVLVVDLQRAFLEDGLGTDHTNQTLATAARVLTAARETGTPVFYVRVAFGPDEEAGRIWRVKAPPVAACRYGTDRIEIHPMVAPAQGDRVIDKQWVSAFFDTPLHDELSGLGVDTLVVMGTSTGGCVSGTVVDAAQLDYRVVVVEDAVEDRSAESHRSRLADFDAKYADVLPAEEVITELRRRGAG